MRWNTRRSEPDEELIGAAGEAARMLRDAADEIEGSPLWYRSKGFADYFVMGDLGKGSHFGRRGDYINRLTGLPFVFEDIELSEFDAAYRCADGQLRLTATRALGESLWDIGEQPSYRLAYEAATRVVVEQTRSACDNLEVFNDDPGLCAGSADVAALFREAALSLEGSGR